MGFCMQFERRLYVVNRHFAVRADYNSFLDNADFFTFNRMVTGIILVMNLDSFFARSVSVVAIFAKLE